MTLRKFTPTTPDGRFLLSRDFTADLAQLDGVTIVSVTAVCAVHEESEVIDPDPQDRLDGAPFVTTGNKVSAWFQEGVAGCDYIVTFIAVYSNGEEVPVDAIIEINDYNNVGT